MASTPSPANVQAAFLEMFATQMLTNVAQIRVKMARLVWTESTDLNAVAQMASLARLAT